MQNTWDKIAEQIPPNSTVLDIGCGYGDLAKRLADKRGLLYGVEIDTQRLAAAEVYYKEISKCDLQKEEILFKDGRNIFDIVVLADVLEHVLNGETLLNKIKKYLSREGIILVSLPNIAHWTIRKGLLCGRFDYTEYGILDKTHIHFYTLKSAKALFRKCGLRIIKLDCTTSGIPFIGGLLKFLPFGNKVANSLYRRYPAFLGSQFIFNLKPETDRGLKCVR